MNASSSPARDETRSDAPEPAPSKPEPDPARAREAFEGSIAAVDLGSNSFHMSVARVSGGEPRVVDRLRSRVALAAGLDAQRNLTPEACERALEALGRFAQRLRDLPPANVRAVGTSALRQARNADEFLERAQATLGHEIEIISGHEEARLIYLGVAHDLADDQGRRLVIDIGGGSTECVVGEEFEPTRTDSLHMGCVQTSLEFFGDGRITQRAFERAEVAARLQVRPIERLYRGLGWENCVGSSGTILSIEAVLRESGWAGPGITPKGLRKLRKALISFGQVDRIALPGLAPERQSVICGGLAILMAMVSAFQIETMKTSGSALRDGLVYDVLGRIRHEDVRDRTIRSLSERYRVDVEQAQRVGRTALALFDKVAPAWRLDGPEDRRLLRWAAMLHELGLSIAFSGHHAHGAYIIQHTDMPGFSRDHQHFLAALVLSHRRKLSRERIATLLHHDQERCLRLAALLRLAVLLNRSRSPRRLPRIEVEAGKSSLRLGFPTDWLEEHPLTREDLVQERERLAAVGLALELPPDPAAA